MALARNLTINAIILMKKFILSSEALNNTSTPEIQVFLNLVAF